MERKQKALVKENEELTVVLRYERRLRREDDRARRREIRSLQRTVETKEHEIHDLKAQLAATWKQHRLVMETLGLDTKGHSLGTNGKPVPQVKPAPPEPTLKERLDNHKRTTRQPGGLAHD